MNRGKSNFLAFTGFILFVSLLPLVWIHQNTSSIAQSAEKEHECFPFLPNSQVPGQYQITNGNGEITRSSHSKVVPVGFGRNWRISSGGYNPIKKQIMLVIKNRYIGIFLKRTLTNNKSVPFIARTCGSSSSFASRIHRLITPGLFFESRVFDIPCSFPDSQTTVCFAFQGTLIKKNNRIQGEFSASSGFFLTDNHSFPELKINKPLKGSVQGKFTLNLKPGRSNNFPEPTDTDTVRGLW